MNATQMLVIAIIMPTIVGDIGGGALLHWAAMLYTIGAVVGGASTGMVWSRLGARRAYTLGADVFALGTVCCALAPNIGSLIAARGVQGWAGGLVSGSGMAPLMLAFAGLAYWKIPDRLSCEAERSRFVRLPFLRFGTLAAGVLCVAASGSVPGAAPRVLLIIAAAA